MELTLVQPAVGRRQGAAYLKTWQMEPLQLAVLAALTPSGVDVRLLDDRVERIDYDRPTDLVAISVETYTALRSYQIASEFRHRGVPVVLGGFHPSLVPGEASIYGDSVVVGEAESVWETVIDDYLAGTPGAIYRGEQTNDDGLAVPDRSIFNSKKYLPIALVEAGRGCFHRCDFCSIAAFHGSSVARYSVDRVARQMSEVSDSKKFVFLVDDNFGADLDRAKDLCRLLIPKPVRWVGQCSIDALRDEELVELMVRSGCGGVLVGFETLNPANLGLMNKQFNAIADYGSTMRMLAAKGLCIYGTFVFGYDNDTEDVFDEAVHFAKEHSMYLAAFNHLVPFPGTPIYQKLREQKRLFKDEWWMDPDYGFNQVTFRPANMTSERLRERCLESRRKFYSWGSVARRGLSRPNRHGVSRTTEFFLINALQKREVADRDGYPLGDQRWEGRLLPAVPDAVQISRSG